MFRVFSITSLWAICFRGGSNKRSLRREMTIRRVKWLHSLILIILRFLTDDNPRYRSIKNSATVGEHSQLAQPTRADRDESGSSIPLHGVWRRYRSGLITSQGCPDWIIKSFLTEILKLIYKITEHCSSYKPPHACFEIHGGQRVEYLSNCCPPLNAISFGNPQMGWNDS
jgi:hypothetical protein